MENKSQKYQSLNSERYCGRIVMFWLKIAVCPHLFAFSDEEEKMQKTMALPPVAVIAPPALKTGFRRGRPEIF